MKQVMCVWLPNWPLQRLRTERPEFKRRPLVIFQDSGNRGARVVTCSYTLAQQGVTVDMPIAEAQATLQAGYRDYQSPNSAPAFEQWVPSQDLESFRRLAWFCQQYTPQFGIEDAEHPDSLWLDVSGCTHLFGGAAAMAERIGRDFETLGLQTRIAVASTFATSWGVSHFSKEISLAPAGTSQRWTFCGEISPGEESRALRWLPIEALRISKRAGEKLQDFDISQIGQLERLPRADLPSRFGPAVLQRLDEALGTDTEVLTPEHPPQPVCVEWTGEYVISDRQAVETIFAQLIEQAVVELTDRQQATTKLECQLCGPSESGATEEMGCFSVGLLRPTQSADHLIELTSMQLGQFQLNGEVSNIRITANASRLLARRQQELFDFGDSDEAANEFNALIDRLSNRLGIEAVVRASVVPDARPEHAFQLQPLIGQSMASFQSPTKSSRRKSSKSRRERGGSSKPANDTKSTESNAESKLPALLPTSRPLLLQPEPVPLDQPQSITISSNGRRQRQGAGQVRLPEGCPSQFQWSGQTHRIRRVIGPERIETAWWSEPTSRDYYRVETQTGHQFWLYKDRGDNRWYLHGEF